MENIMDLTFLTEKERQLILEVLNRDDEVRQKEESRIERLKNKAARTNNPTIQKKIKMRTGEWFWELAEKQGSLKRNGTVNASVRASLRLKPKSRPPLKGSPPIVEIEAVSDPEEYAEKPLDEDHLSDNVHYLNDASGGEEGYMTIDNKVEAANQMQEMEVTIDSPFSSDSDNEDRGNPVIASAKVHALSSLTEGESHEFPQQNDASSSEDELMQNFVNPGHVTDAMRHDFHVLTHNDDEGRQVSSSEENLPHSEEERTSRDEDSLRSSSVEVVVVDVPIDAGATSTTDSSSTTSNQLKPDEDHPANHTLAEEQVTAPDVVEDEEDEDTKILNEFHKAMTSPAYLDAKTDNEPTVVVSEEANNNDSLTSSHPEGDEKDDQECKDEEQGKKKKKGLLGGSTPNLNAISITKPSFGSSWSVYSTTSGVVRDDIEVSGSVEIGLDYSYSTGTLNVHVGSCYTLAAAEGKKLSNPYVKTYLLPDKNSKRKTKAKKKTVNPSFNETLKYVIPESELATRTLNVAVWHDKVGVNVFLGEVNITLDLFDSSAPNKMEEYQLLPRGARVEESLSNYMGDVDVALRLSSSTQQDAFNEGQLEIVLKNVKNVKPSKANGMCSVYVKGYFLPDPSQVTKQKTPVMTGTGSIVFDHLFVYTNVQVAELQQRCLELSVWQYEKYTANKLIGGVRLGTGTGESFNVKVPWMDSHNAEVSLWKRMLRHTGSWVEEQVPLRVVEPWK